MRALTSLIATGLCLLTVSSVFGEAIQNGDFELGTGTDADNWNEIEVMGGVMGATAMADRDSSMPNGGMMSLGVVGAPDFGPVAEIQQQTAVGSVTAGVTYDFSFFAKGTPGPGSVGFYEVLWFDGDGSAGGGPQGSATGLQTFGLTAAYTENGASGLTAPAGADSIFVSLRLVTGAFDGASGSAFIDDVSFASQPIPEPAAGFVIVAGLLLSAKRRKRA